MRTHCIARGLALAEVPSATCAAYYPLHMLHTTATYSTYYVSYWLLAQGRSYCQQAAYKHAFRMHARISHACTHLACMHESISHARIHLACTHASRMHARISHLACTHASRMHARISHVRTHLACTHAYRMREMSSS